MTSPQHPTGRREARAGHDRVVFRRTFRAPIADVWAAVTQPRRLERWVGTWEGDPADGWVGFRMTAEAEDAAAERMHIDECDPPRRLAVHSVTEYGTWYLELDLEETAGVTTLTFAQRISDAGTAADVGPGWDYYLDRLVAAETGADVAAIDFTEYHEADKEYYRALFAAGR
jgi:uncharacterized protein YndB with AHSA1/START domain